MWTPGPGHQWSRISLWMRRWRTIVLAIAVVLANSPLFAQDEGGESGGSAVSSSRGWIVEAVIVAALFALALFVICRSSRRN